MASRYWVFGSATWSSTNTGNWSTSSGGGSGASVPTAVDNVIFDANSNVGVGAFTVTLADSPRVCNNFTVSGLDGAMTLSMSAAYLDVSGLWTNPATNFTFAAFPTAITFNAVTTGNTVTTNGVTFPQTTFSGVGGGWTLGSAFNPSTSVTLSNGTLDLAGYTLTTPQFNIGSGTKNLTFNGGTTVCTGTVAAWNNSLPIGFTTTAGTGTGVISLTAATAKTFVGAGSTYNCTLNQGGAGALTITGSNTFNNITNTIQPATVSFTAGTTSTFTSFSLSGTAGNLITIGSVTAASHTLFKAGSTVSCNYLSISRSTATGGAGWFAGITSTDGGNNSGWIFTVPTYAATIAETSTATDAISNLAIFISSVAETSTATDATVGNIKFSVSIVEIATVTDSAFTNIAVVSSVSVIETVAVTDSATAISVSLVAYTFNPYTVFAFGEGCFADGSTNEAWRLIDTAQTSNWTQISTVVATGAYTFNPYTVFAFGEGCFADGSIDEAWGLINTTQTPNWTIIPTVN